MGKDLRLNSKLATWTWLLGIFMMLSFVADSAQMGVSEAYSHSDSATTLYSSDNYLKCTSDLQVTVSSTQEISDLVKLYSNKPVRMRATRRGFHSSMGFVCSGERGSSYAEYDPIKPHSNVSSITVLLHLMNRVVSVDRDQYFITVEAGMTLRGLALAAEANAMSVPAGALSLYSNLTVGGVIMASAHGTGYRATCSLGDLVRTVKWVNARGEIIVSQHQSKEMRALVGGLGLLGIVTELTLQLQPNSRTVVEVRKGLNDAHMVADLTKILQDETPHAMSIWRPDLGVYKAVLWTPVEDGEYNSATMPKFYPNGSIAPNEQDEQGATFAKQLLAAWEADVKDESPAADLLNAGICMAGQAAVDASVFVDGDGTFLDHATIQTNYAMVGADCIPKCSWDVHYMGTFTEDTEFTIKLSKFEDWVDDVKTIVRTELGKADARLSQCFGKSVKQCMSPGYFTLRFGHGNEYLLSTSTGSDDVVYVQFSGLHSALLPNQLSKASAIAETIEQLTLCKYQGRPHWGKNHERIARHSECPVLENFPAENIQEMLEIQQKHDPRKVFEPELFRQLVHKSGPEYSPLCTPHFWCHCAADSHCPPGFQCRPSASFSEYQICTLV